MRMSMVIAKDLRKISKVYWVDNIMSKVREERIKVWLINVEYTEIDTELY